MRGLTSRFDQLSLLGKPLNHEDKIEYIIDGLPEEYKSVAEQIEGRDTTPSIIEIHEKLINKEAKLIAVSAPVSSSIPVTANVASARPKQHQSQYNRSNNNSNWNKSYKSNNSSMQKQENQSTKGYQGRCQLCGVFGHSARRCTQMSQQYVNTGSSPFRPWQPRANMAVAAQHPTNAWLMDSGATHHLTSDLHNLSLHQPYLGDDSVMIGDGTGLPITHTGSISLPSPARTLRLNDVLCVPNIQKNLISVYRLCNTNKVSVEFFSASFQVKDLCLGIPLIQGKTKDELYE